MCASTVARVRALQLFTTKMYGVLVIAGATSFAPRPAEIKIKNTSVMVSAPPSLAYDFPATWEVSEGTTDTPPPIFADWARKYAKNLFCLEYEPQQWYEQVSSPNRKGSWDSSFDILKETSPKGKYGFIFLHGAKDYQSNPDNIKFVDALLQVLPGRAVLVQAMPTYAVDHVLLKNPIDLDNLPPGEAKEAYGATYDDVLECRKQTTAPAPCNPDCLKKIGFNASQNTFSSAMKGNQWFASDMAIGEDDSSCYADPSKYDDAHKQWAKVGDYNADRIKKWVDTFTTKWKLRGENIYIIGFSLGAVMAARVGVELASKGIAIGGVIGIDGKNVEMIAPQATFAALKNSLKMLYIIVGEEWDKPPETCLRSFPNIELQFHGVSSKDQELQHSPYLQLLPLLKTWIKAGHDKQAVVLKVREEFRAAHDAICDLKVNDDFCTEYINGTKSS